MYLPLSCPYATPSDILTVSVLMSSKPEKPSSGPSHEQKDKPRFFKDRDGLGAYIRDPMSFPPSRVIYHNASFVAINDLFPKSSVHALLLPRPTEKHVLHPFDAFTDVAFLAAVRTEAKNLHRLVAKELQRKYGKFSAQDQVRERVLSGDVDVTDGTELPAGRNWERDVMVGVHGRPSMAHLHVHVISIDRFSEKMKHRKHYNSFATPFFVPLEDFPLAEYDDRRHPTKEGYLDRDLVCWRCGVNFGRSFTKLKAHLVEEFENWKCE
jgi:aprataxin